MRQVERFPKVVIITLLAFIVIGLIAKYMLRYFTPFLLALMMAAVIDPLVDFLEERVHISRGVAVLFVLLAFLVLVALFLTLMVTNLTAELNQFLSILPRYSSYWKQDIQDAIDRLEHFYAQLGELPEPFHDVFQPNVDSLAETLKELASRSLGFLGQIPSFFFTILIASIATFFISRDKQLFLEFMLGLVPKAWRPSATHIKTEVVSGILGFLRSQLMLISLTAGLAVIGLTVLRIRYAWLLGLLAGILDLIPMIGPSGVFLPLIAYHLLVGNIIYAALLTVVLGIILITRQLSEPRIVGAQIGLHPLTSLIAIYVGIQWLGVSGFILGPLIAVVLKAIMVVVVIPSLRKV